MRSMIRVFWAVVMVLVGVHVAFAYDDGDERSDYLHRLAIERGQTAQVHFDGGTVLKFEPVAFVGNQAAIVLALANLVRSKLGEQWVNVALKIAEVESRFQPNAVGPKTKYGRAYGLGQLLLSSARALGYQGDAKGLLDPQTNITYMVAHMQKCSQNGVVSEADMAGCHVAGWDNFRSRSYYAVAYRNMVANARIDGTNRVTAHRVKHRSRHHYARHHTRRQHFAMR